MSLFRTDALSGSFPFLSFIYGNQQCFCLYISTEGTEIFDLGQIALFYLFFILIFPLTKRETETTCVEEAKKGVVSITVPRLGVTIRWKT
jgi:hypothetical protein